MLRRNRRNHAIPPRRGSAPGCLWGCSMIRGVRWRTVPLLVFLFGVCVSGCGGGILVAGGGTGGTGISVGIIAGFGSVFVGGIEYDDTGAEIVIDNTAGHTASELKVGMRVKVSGRFNSVAGTGTADRIEVLSEIRGRLDDNGVDLSNNRIFVMGREILVLPSTAFDNVADLATLEQILSGGSHPEVEVQGAPDDSGRIHATYIRMRSNDFGAGQNASVRGTVSGLSGTSFFIDGTAVEYSTVGIVPGLDNGSFVEVRGTFTPGSPPTIFASVVEVEDPAPGSEGDEVQVDGYVLSGTASSFEVGGPSGPVMVATDGRTQYAGGDPGGIMPGVRVRVEGVFFAGGILAGKVMFEMVEGVLLEGIPTGVDPLGGTLTIFTKTVAVDRFTKFEDDRDEVRPFGIADIVPAVDFLKIVGWYDSGANRVVASLVERVDPPVDNRSVVQGPVAPGSVDNTTGSFQLLKPVAGPGLTVFTDPAATVFRIGESGVPRDQFFQELAAGPAVVRTRYINGVVPPTGAFADEVAIETVNP